MTPRCPHCGNDNVSLLELSATGGHCVVCSRDWRDRADIRKLSTNVRTLRSGVA